MATICSECGGSHAAGALPHRTVADRFEVLEFIGSGGFGEVFKARDLRLERIVALKTIPREFAENPVRRERFWREAKAASALNHPNICTVFDLVEGSGQHFLVMEFVEGSTLHDLLDGKAMTADEAIPIALQIADALAEAHRIGIIHRDIKSSNIVLTPNGKVKILDFGLAKHVAPDPSDDETAAQLTGVGTSPGTPQYMSPEQLLGSVVDQRTDLFSFGVVMYEMLSGRPPFQGSSGVAIVDAVLHSDPPPLSNVPPQLERVTRKLLEKDRARRYGSADEIRRNLMQLQRTETSAPTRRRTAMAAAAVIVLILAAVVPGAWSRWQHQKKVTWARATALPQIDRLAGEDKYAEAVELAGEVEKVIPGDPALAKLWPEITYAVTIRTTPPGADVFFTGNDKLEWRRLGRSPIVNGRMPRGLFYRLRIEKPGYETALRFFPAWFGGPKPPPLEVVLDPAGSSPQDMVRVSGGDHRLTTLGFEHLDAVRVDEYFIDRYEVTNAEFQRFVDADGYRKREFWSEPFRRDGREVPWEAAMASFRDTTGRPGPATWELGTFPQGQEKHPVSGVSWYEAVAYARFAGKELPSIFHWNRGADTHASGVIVPRSNFTGNSARPVGFHESMSGFGTFDMAGNVKEWCWNRAEGEKRYILGGGWGEPDYLFADSDAQSPWERRPRYGFRCVKLLEPAPVAAVRPIWTEPRDLLKQKPVGDELFRTYRSLYSYDQTSLDATVESVDRTNPHWVVERISMDAAYGGERLIAYLYLPKRGKPPFQTVVYFPGSGAIRSQRVGDSPGSSVEFIIRGGRALLFPVYKSTFERQDGLLDTTQSPTAHYRDHLVAWYRDMARAVDYAVTRKDVEATRLAYYGLSWGGRLGAPMVALEPRFKAAVFASGGLNFQHVFPEADPLNFAPRVTIPVLMINGSYDHVFPLETSATPLFRALGTPAAHKRHAIFPTGHAPPRAETIRETLDWLDRYLGPV